LYDRKQGVLACSFAALSAEMRGIMADALRPPNDAVSRHARLIRGGAPKHKNLCPQTPHWADASATLDVHQTCGQLCGEPVLSSPKPAPLCAIRLFANFSGKVFAMRIKGLQMNDSTVTAPTCDFACIGAPVEFPSRTSRGFWRG
jgi:hypothetical protein